MCELLIALKTVKGTTPGPDRICYDIIKHLTNQRKTTLIQLYNNVFDSGIIPHSWKTAIIAAIPKPNRNPTQFTGYRPISLLSCLSKLTERKKSKKN